MGVTLSIIIPIYNSEKTLNQCVDSVLYQAFKDYELILVDDGSNDKSSQICDEYASKDERVKVIHKENGGVSSARNAGLDVAVGKWICVIDSDDYIKDCFLTDLSDYEEDLLITNAFSERNDTISRFWRYELKQSSVRHTKELGCFIDKNMDIFKVPWGKFYKHTLIGNLRFNLGLKIGEDAEFVFNYLTKITSVATLTKSSYIVRNYYGIPINIKYSMTTPYAINSLTTIFKAYDKASSIFNLRRYNFIFYYFFFKLLSKNDWRKHPYMWYCDRETRNIYKYIYNSLTKKQKIKENAMFSFTTISKIFNI